jgi:hypothetical protein
VGNSLQKGFTRGSDDLKINLPKFSPDHSPTYGAKNSLNNFQIGDSSTPKIKNSNTISSKGHESSLKRRATLHP